MGKRRKTGEISEQREVEDLRSETEVKSDKKKQKRKRDQQLDSSLEIQQPRDQRDPLRVFLESLYQQLPEELIKGWMIEWGLLTREEVMKALENVNEKDVLSDGT